MAPDHEYPSYLELQLTATRRRRAHAHGHAAAGSAHGRADHGLEPVRRRAHARDRDRDGPFTRDVILGSKLAITASTPVTIGGSSYAFSSWSDGGARTHDVTANAAATYTADYSRVGREARRRRRVGTNVSEANPGRAEVYRTVADVAGRATALRVYLDATSSASAVVIGLYGDSGGQPSSLLASGRLANPQAGAWNQVTVSGPSLTAGTAYWISVLNPADGAGVLRWRDRAGGSGGAEQTSQSQSLVTLPGTWATGADLERRADLRPRSGDPERPGDPGPRRDARVAVVQRHRGRRQPGGQDARRGQRGRRDALVHRVRRRLLADRHARQRDGSARPQRGGQHRRARRRDLHGHGDRDGRWRGGSPQAIPVTLVVAPATPVLAVTPSSLSFTRHRGRFQPGGASRCPWPTRGRRALVHGVRQRGLADGHARERQRSGDA